VDWRLRRALGENVGRRVNVKGNGLTCLLMGDPRDALVSVDNLIQEEAKIKRFERGDYKDLL